MFIALLTFKMASPAGKDCKDPSGKVGPLCFLISGWHRRDSAARILLHTRLFCCRAALFAALATAHTPLPGAAERSLQSVCTERLLPHRDGGSAVDRNPMKTPKPTPQDCDFHQSLELYRFVSAMALLGCGSIYLLGGILCFGLIKRSALPCPLPSHPVVHGTTIPCISSSGDSVRC